MIKLNTENTQAFVDFFTIWMWKDTPEKWNKFNLFGRIFIFPFWFLIRRIPSMIFWGIVYLIATLGAWLIVGFLSVCEWISKMYKKLFYEKST